MYGERRQVGQEERCCDAHLASPRILIPMLCCMSILRFVCPRSASASQRLTGSHSVGKKGGGRVSMGRHPLSHSCVDVL